jgi:DNA-binding transcriptional LysR family regulator
MEFKQLRSFVEVIHRGGFTQAGENPAHQPVGGEQTGRTAGTQPGHAVARPLGSQMRLTAAGQVVLQRAEAMLRLRTSCSASWMICSHLARGELRLGLPQLGGDALFADLFAEYRRRYPNVSIQLLEGGSRSIEQAMLSGELEVGGSLKPKDPHSPGKPSAMNRWMPCCRWTIPGTARPGCAWKNWPTRRS